MTKKCLAEVKANEYPDENEKALKSYVSKAGVQRHFFDSVIPWQVASQQSLLPFHRTVKA
jgi:hypothetical protein